MSNCGGTAVATYSKSGNCKALPNCGLEERIKELGRKNEEYSQMIQRLLNTVETEREIYEKRIREMGRQSDEQIRRLANKCREQKLNLINRNLEIERELKRILDTKECTFVETSREIDELQDRLTKALMQLDCKSKVLKEVEEERDKLRHINKRLDCKLKDHQQRSNNYKNMLEQEILDLKCKLKDSERKNVELLNDIVNKDMQCLRDMPVVKDDCDECDPSEQLLAMCRAKARQNQACSDMGYEMGGGCGMSSGCGMGGGCGISSGCGKSSNRFQVEMCNTPVSICHQRMDSPNSPLLHIPDRMRDRSLSSSAASLDSKQSNRFC